MKIFIWWNILSKGANSIWAARWDWQVHQHCVGGAEEDEGLQENFTQGFNYFLHIFT